MTEDEEYRVYMINLPGSIRGAVRLDEDGFASVYINDQLSPKAKKAALRHEVRHIRQNDHENRRSIMEIEAQ